MRITISDGFSIIVKVCCRRKIRYDILEMRDLVILFIHLLVTIARLFGPGGVRSIVADSLLTKHQLVVISRATKRAPR